MSLRESRRKHVATRTWATTGLVCFLALASCAAGADGPKDFRQKFKVSLEDVVVSMPVDQKHLTVARGSRAWRKVTSFPKPLQRSLFCLLASS